MAMSKKCNFPVWPPSDLGKQNKTRMEISSKMKSMTTSEHRNFVSKGLSSFLFSGVRRSGTLVRRICRGRWLVIEPVLVLVSLRQVALA